MREFWQRWKGLLPAVLVAVGVVVALAVTQPQLEEVPELLLPAVAAESTPEPTATATPEPEEEAASAAELSCADGVYLGTAQGYGGEIEVRVTVDGGEIMAIDVVSAEGETPRFFKRARRILNTMMESNTWDVDLISGATLSSRGLHNAVKNALTGVSNTKKTVKKQGNLSVADGRYVGSAEGFGGEVRVRVTVQSGQIIAVDLLEAEGETENFLTRAREVMPDILTANSWQVDSISGATYSSRGIINAVKNALTGTAEQAAEELVPTETPVPTEQIEEEAQPTSTPSPTVQPTETPDAVSGSTPLTEWIGRVKDWLLPDETAESSSVEATPEPSAQPTPEPTATPEPAQETAAAAYRDGTYSGTATCKMGSRFDYDVTVHFTVENGVIGTITVKKGADRSEEPLDNDDFLAAAVAYVPEQIVGQQSADSIDAVSGATYSSKAIQAAVQAALEAGPQEANAS